MNLSKNTVLITGGATGIGYSLAEAFVKEESTVIICGRRKNALEEAKKKLPNLIIHACDVSVEHERIALDEWIKKEHSAINILINNAGIQQRMNLGFQGLWENAKEELAVNLEAPIHLSNLFIPILVNANNPALINVTSGLAFVPLAFAPVYCATKAGLHSYTLSLRHQLKKTPVRVIEIIPPAVNTDLGGAGLHTDGTPLDEFRDAVVKQLKEGSLEITYGFSSKISRSSRDELDTAFARMNQ
jgi:uncharacterized oxidoreductase